MPLASGKRAFVAFAATPLTWILSPSSTVIVAQSTVGVAFKKARTSKNSVEPEAIGGNRDGDDDDVRIAGMIRTRQREERTLISSTALYYRCFIALAASHSCACGVRDVVCVVSQAGRALGSQSE